MPPEYTEQLNTMYTTTWQLRRSEIFDQVTTALPLYYLLTAKGRVEKREGGRYIEEALEYGTNSSVTTFGKGDEVTLVADEVLTVSHWNWKYLTGHIVRHFTEFQQNRGKAALIRKVNADIRALRRGLTSKMNTMLFGDGTGNGGKDWDGLQNIVSTTPTTGDPGGVDRATYTWWRNQMSTMSGVSVSLRLRDYMTTMYNNCGLIGDDGPDRFPDLIVTTQTISEAYEQECFELATLPLTGVAGKMKADLGLGALSFKGVPVVWDAACPSGCMYFLNTNFLRLIVDDIAWLKMGEWEKIPLHIEDYLCHNITVGNVVCSRCASQGVIHTIDPVTNP